MNKVIDKSSRRLYIKYLMRTISVVQLYDWMSLFLEGLFQFILKLKVQRVENVGILESGSMVSKYAILESGPRMLCFDFPKPLKPALGR